MCFSHKLSSMTCFPEDKTVSGVVGVLSEVSEAFSRTGKRCITTKWMMAELVRFS